MRRLRTPHGLDCTVAHAWHTVARDGRLERCGLLGGPGLAALRPEMPGGSDMKVRRWREAASIRLTLRVRANRSGHAVDVARPRPVPRADPLRLMLGFDFLFKLLGVGV
jgi:hypothetical protein